MYSQNSELYLVLSCQTHLYCLAMMDQANETVYGEREKRIKRENKCIFLLLRISFVFIIIGSIVFLALHLFILKIFPWARDSFHSCFAFKCIYDDKYNVFKSSSTLCIMGTKHYTHNHSNNGVCTSPFAVSKSKLCYIYITVQLLRSQNFIINKIKRLV